MKPNLTRIHLDLNSKEDSATGRTFHNVRSENLAGLLYAEEPS